ncbi:MAG: hypothetical protein GX256_02335 [Fretibacterium sp.]|nr:hypothetical protein [Fretibacterium sp.]
MPAFRKERGPGIEGLDFYRILGDDVLRLPAGAVARRLRRTVSLAPLRSLSVSEFSFSFGNLSRVREALKLQILPYAATGSVELFPTPLERTSRSCRGLAWYVASGELGFPAPPLEVENLVWPAPLPLVSEIGTEGVTMWVDEENVCSLLWEEGLPSLYRWRPRDKATPESELSWLDNYCRSRNGELKASFVWDATQSDPSTLLGIIDRSLKVCPWISTVNLSTLALSSAMGLERAVGLLSNVAGWALVLGLFVLGGNALRWNRAQQDLFQTRELASDLYKKTFEPDRTGRVPDPLRLARDILAERAGDAEDGTLEDALSELGVIFTENPSMNVTLDILRYNAEGLNCTGSAPDMTTVLAFRKAWEARADLVQVENTQNVPGLGYRFDLRVRGLTPSGQQ